MANGNSDRLTAKEGRRFALTLASAFAVIALVANWRNRESVLVGGALTSSILLLLALTIPSRLGPLQRAWDKFGLLLSRITSPIFLGVVYFIVITPVGVLRRILGKNSLHRPPVDGSYWKERAQPDTLLSQKQMERQF